MNRKVEMIVAVVCFASAATWAQMPPGGSMGGRNSFSPGQGAGQGLPETSRVGQGDPMLENFFPPELVMQNQKAIGLKEDQQTAIRAEMQKTMARFTDLQWQQSAENETFAELVKAERPDEGKVLAQLDKLLTIESEIKRLRFAMMLKVKNALTAEQQTKLRELMRAKRPSSGMGFQGRSPQGQGQGQGRSAPMHRPSPGSPEQGAEKFEGFENP
ncbi:MAG: hypothetical protein HYV36_07060 [Lentisphaerae bacterium]|nr:hypothetical protein [Lentisphaerota bacterium]